MRIHFPNMSRPKQAAKKIASKLEHVPLSKVQAVLAVSLGYQDWHELNTAHAKQLPTPLDETWSRDQAQAFYLNAALHFMALGNESPSAIVAAIASSRMAGARRWEREDYTALLFAAWRCQKVLGTERRSIGSIVRMRERSTKEIGYLCHLSDVAYILFNGNYGMCADFEVVTPKVRPADFMPARLWRPYGYWTLKDGSEVVFSRDYLTLWHVKETGTNRLPPWLRVSGIQSEHFFGGPQAHWMTGSAEVEAIAYLEKRKIYELPMLVDAFPELLGTVNGSVKAGVKKLMFRCRVADPEGSWKRDSLN